MEKLLIQLLKVLREQLSCCRQLLKLSKAESDALKENDIQGLFRLSKEITVLSQQLAKLEEERTQVHSQAACRMGLAGDTGLRELLAALGGLQTDLAVSLEEEALILNAAFIALKQQNELNQLLLRQAAAYAGTIISVLRPDYRLTYGKGGGMFRSKLKSPFVNRTV